MIDADFSVFLWFGVGGVTIQFAGFCSNSHLPHYDRGWFMAERRTRWGLSN